MYTKGLDSNWYTVNISDLTANNMHDVLDYFRQRAERPSDRGKYTKIGETTIKWSTQYEDAEEIMLLGLENGDKGVYLDTAAVLTAKQRADKAAAARAARKSEKSVAKAAVDSIDVSDAEF